MSVIVTIRVSGDATAFEEQVAAQAEAIGRIMEVAKRHGLIAQRCGELPGLLRRGAAGYRPGHAGAGVTSPPDVTFWRNLETNDEVGWNA
jgi:hypothetical protein